MAITRSNSLGQGEDFDVGNARKSHRSNHCRFAGSAGGNTVNLGAVLNSIVGAIGGGVGGQILTALIPMLSGTAGNIDIGALVGQAAGGGVAGAILTAIVGMIKNKVTS